MYYAVFPSFTQQTTGLKPRYSIPRPRTDRPCFYPPPTHTPLNRYETSLFWDNKTPKENLALYINRSLNGRTVNTELLRKVVQIWFPGLQLDTFFFTLHHVQMFQQPCWVFNNLQFRDFTYSVPFVHLPRKLYNTRRIIHIKNVPTAVVRNARLFCSNTYLACYAPGARSNT